MTTNKDAAQKAQNSVNDELNADVEFVYSTVNALDAQAVDYLDNTLIPAQVKIAPVIKGIRVAAEKIRGSKSRVTALDQVLADKDLVVRGKPSVIRKLIKAMTGVNSKFASKLAIITEASIQQEIDPDNIDAWIKESGGTEEIRLKASKSGVSRKKLVDAGERIVQQSEACATIEANAETPANPGYAVAIVYVHGDGRTERHGYCEHASVKKAYFEQFGREALKAKREQEAAVSDEDLIEQIASKVEAATSSEKAA